MVFLFSLSAYAKHPISAVCDKIYGTRIKVHGSEVSIDNDRISSKISFVFDYENELILDNQGSEYVMFAKKDMITGYFSLKKNDMFITFFPKENRVLISKHSYLKPLDFKIDISSWTMQGECKFEY